MSTFAKRMIGAASLDVPTYEEVEADTTATTQAMGVVVLSSLAQGIGFVTQGGGVGFIVGAIGALIGWIIWAFLVYLIGTKLLPEPQTRSDLGELLRTTGFAAAPGLLRVLGVIPLLGGLIMPAVTIWMLIAMVIAVRQALDYKSTFRAVGVCLMGWIVFVLILVWSLQMFGGGST
ncbi:MAG: YIP1 family protein [Acidobacteria bacterium]|nr:YIP1 family protein [Acidobacteriota bacterium]